MNTYRVYIGDSRYWVIRANSHESALSIGQQWSINDDWLGYPTGRVELAV